MDVRRVGDRECIHCGACADVCSQVAIAVRAGRITLKGPGESSSGTAQKNARIIRAAALFVLCLALMWFNVLDPAVKKKSPPVRSVEAGVTVADSAADAGEGAPEGDASDTPVGHEVGQRLEDFTRTCYDGTVFHLADQRGRITFINLWATYFALCLQDLPYFSELYGKHEGDIAMIAVHPSLVTDDPLAFIADKGYAMPFATDDDTVLDIVGSTGAYPQTIVLDRRGEVYNRVGSVARAMLPALYDEADALCPR